MEHRCVHCHFLAKKVEKQGIAVVEPVSRSERAKLLQNKCDLPGVEAFQCHMKVWDERFDMGIKNRAVNLLEKDRKGKCFFYQMRPNMSFETAQEQQKKNPNPPPEGFTLLGERAWLLWIVSAFILMAVTLYTIAE